MLSATFPTAVRQLTERFQTDPLHVEGTRLGLAHEDISHVGHLVRPHDRYGAVVNLLLLAGDQRTLIFVATRVAAGALAEKLAGDGFSTLPLSGDLAQAQRTRTLNAFRAGTVSVLVATDVAARGLDVPEVSTIIHGDLPMDGQVYTHRSGRTGRAGRKGRSILLATPNSERRARRIFADAAVDAEWQIVPSGTAIDKALTKRMRRRVRKLIEGGTDSTSEAALEFARKLLEGRDQAQVVAALLASMRSERTREPFDLETPMPRPARQTSRPGDSRPGDSRPGASRPGATPFTRFLINWGFRNGANPSRLLATICRRGDVSSRVIGEIDIEAYSATFDVANDAASQFELRARRRDARDPNQHIERVTAGHRPKRFRKTQRYRAG
jgi:ATP-dependent RNA helicase DeaD